jgi:hypothetical protein
VRKLSSYLQFQGKVGGSACMKVRAVGTHDCKAEVPTYSRQLGEFPAHTYRSMHLLCRCRDTLVVQIGKNQMKNENYFHKRTSVDEWLLEQAASSLLFPPVPFPPTPTVNLSLLASIFSGSNNIFPHPRRFSHGVPFDFEATCKHLHLATVLRSSLGREALNAP